MANPLKAIDTAAISQRLLKAERSAASALERTRKRLLKPLYRQIDYYETQLARLKKLVAGVVSAPMKKSRTSAPAAKPAKAKARTAGGRRGKEELHRDALKAVAIIKAKGKDGASLKDIASCGITGTPRAWFKANAPEAKVVMRGKRAAARYFVE